MTTFAIGVIAVVVLVFIVTGVLLLISEEA